MGHSLRWLRRAWIPMLGMALVLSMFLTAGSVTALADDDPDFDSRNGEKLGERKTLIYDRFTLDKGQSADMDGREPDTASIGSTWSVEFGAWEITGRRGGQAVERSPDDWTIAPDKRVNIDARSANVIVSSRIKRGSGYQYSGVTARHSGPVDWLGAWFDPEGWPPGVPGSFELCPDGLARCGAIVLGAKDQSQAPGQFIELYRARFDWREGKKHTITLVVIGNRVRVLVDGRVRIEATFEGLGDATEVGLFSRGAGETQFENFLATGRVRLGAVVKKAVEKWTSDYYETDDASGLFQAVGNLVNRLRR